MKVYEVDVHSGAELLVEDDTDVDGNALSFRVFDDVDSDGGGCRRIRLRMADVQELADALERWLTGER